MNNLINLHLINLQAARRERRQTNASGITLRQSGFHKLVLSLSNGWQAVKDQPFKVYDGNRALFKAHLDEEIVGQIRNATNENYALGSERFQKEIEAALGRRARRGQAGRPGRPGTYPSTTRANWACCDTGLTETGQAG